MPQNSIGEFEVLRISAPPTPKQRSLLVEARPGVDGIAVWDTGYRGVPFVTVTQTPAANQDAARNLTLQYAALTAATPVRIVQGGVMWPAWYQVLQVTPMAVETMAFGMWNGVSGFGSLLVAQWQMIEV